MLLGATPKKPSTSENLAPPNPATVANLEAEVIGLFVELSRLTGQPRSYAEIYGLLFISARPITMEEIIERLGISKGSASQGLRFLHKAAAVKMVYVHRDRRVHYEAVAELRHLVTAFLRDQIIPQLESSRARLEHIFELIHELPAEERSKIRGRITMLQSWAKKSRQFLPLVVKLLGK